MRKLKMILLVAGMLCPTTQNVNADGGTIRLREQREGLQVTVFTSPVPLRAGRVDVSVLVQDKSGNAITPDVRIVARPVSGAGPVVRVPATQASATNQLLQAAKFTLPEAGTWSFEVLVKSTDETEDRFVFEAEVAPALERWITFWPWFSWPLLAIYLFGKQQQSVRRTAKVSGISS